MRRNANRGVQFSDWPVQDRHAWDAAQQQWKRNAARYKKSPAKDTIISMRGSYGIMLKFLAEVFPEKLEMAPGDRWTESVVEEYIVYLQRNCADITVINYLSMLKLGLRAIAPERDWAWISMKASTLKRTPVTVEKPYVPSPKIYQLGCDLFQDAYHQIGVDSHVSLSAAEKLRDGLIIMLLVEAPIRRRALSRLTVSSSFDRSNPKRWRLLIPKADTKPRRRNESFDLSERLTVSLNYYLRNVRAIFLDADKHDGLLAAQGRPMPPNMLTRVLRRRTYIGPGVAISPHRFRHAAATFLCATDSKNARATRDLLGHESFRMTYRHYVLGAQSRQASRRVNEIIDRIKGRLDDASREKQDNDPIFDAEVWFNGRARTQQSGRKT